MHYLAAFMGDYAILEDKVPCPSETAWNRSSSF